MKCINCNREVYGFWKRGGTAKVCSKECLRQAIADGKISRIHPYTAFPELGIAAPEKALEKEEIMLE